MSVPAMPSAALARHESPLSHERRGPVGMWCLIAAESAMFTIFVVAYLFYTGKSLSGPTPNDVLSVPIFGSICLFSSSVTILMAERAIDRGDVSRFRNWWFLTIALGVLFIFGTAREWVRLIYHEGLTISTNLFGTTFYALVGLHAFHVVVGLTGLSIVLAFTLLGYVRREHAKRIGVFAMYWHFVDAIWAVVLPVVYLIAR
jgi:cytochrome c oxidase subunit 3/cytochrome o ubiquinol oxidase subunit 3